MSITEKAVTGWLKAAAENRVLDMHREMSTLTLRIAGNTLLGTDVSADQEAVAQALNATQREFDHYIARLIHAPRWIPGTIGWQGHRAQKELQRIVQGIIERRRREPSTQPNLLSLMMAARDEESGQGLSDQELADEVLTFLLAGHETTANALTWTLLLLSQNPVCQRRLREEAQRVLPVATCEHRHLQGLAYTECVIKESMRLYPPAWIIERGTEKDAVLGGHRIPKGTMVLVSPYVTHRHPGFWSNPEGFDPERFSPERSASYDRYQYIPFGGGPRVCIGSVFAMMEAQIILALSAKYLQFDLLPGHKVNLDPLVTLRPREGLPMRVHSTPTTVNPKSAHSISFDLT